MTNISAYIIGAVALGASAAWIVGLKTEPASAAVAAATTYRDEDRSVTTAYAVPAARHVRNPFAPVGAHKPGARAPNAGTAPSGAPVPDGAVTVHDDTRDRSGAGQVVHPYDYARDDADQTAPVLTPAASDTPPTDAQGWPDHPARQPAASRTTVRHTGGHLDITIVGSASSDPAAPESVEPAVSAPAPAAVPASYSQQPDCTLYRGGNAYARLVLSQRGCRF